MRRGLLRVVLVTTAVALGAGLLACDYHEGTVVGVTTFMNHPALEADTAAHLREHALEVQLPFLQSRNPGLAIVPVCLADRGLALLLEMGVAMAGVLKARMNGRWLIELMVPWRK